MTSSTSSGVFADFVSYTQAQPSRYHDPQRPIFVLKLSGSWSLLDGREPWLVMARRAASQPLDASVGGRAILARFVVEITATYARPGPPQTVPGSRGVKAGEARGTSKRGLTLSGRDQKERGYTRAREVRRCQR